MGGWRDIKRSGRRVVHDHFCTPALYIHAPGATPFPLTVRGPHNKRPLSVGQLPDSDGWAEREDTQPRLIFMRDELPEGFRQGAIISIELGEAYRLAAFLKSDDIVQAVEVEPLDDADAAGLPVHEAYGG